MKGTLPDRVRLGAFEVHLRAGELRQGEGAVLVLPDQSLQILRMLIEADGEIVNRDQIRQRLWPDDTIVEFDASINTAIKKLRRALVDSADEPHYIGTIAKRGYRLLVPVERLGAEDGSRNSIRTAGPSTRAEAHGRNSTGISVVGAGMAGAATQPAFEVATAESTAGTLPRWTWIALAVVVFAAAVAGVLYWRAHRAPKLTERDTIVVADFDNKTGDPVFDDTLKQALTIQLEQSPFLNVLSSRKVRQTLKLMSRSAKNPMTEDVAREVCIRSGSKAMVLGSLAALGKEYVVGLEAVDCNIGESLGDAQERAAGKEAVLAALDKAITSIRSKLGESLSSVEKYGTSVQQATTPSLEALKAFSTAKKIEYAQGWTAALPFYKRAIELDSEFAMALNDISILYSNLGEGERSQEYGAKAYQLREKVSERERYAIEANYYHHVTGELDKAAQTFELWHQSYPRDLSAVGTLGAVYCSLGNLQRCFEQNRDAMKMEPNYGVVYVNLGAAYENLNRLDEAEQVFQQAEQRGIAAETLLPDWYQLAFLKNDDAQMARIVSASIGKPGAEDLILAAQADTEAWHGRFREARQLTTRAMESAERNDAKETAADYLVAAALREVAVGHVEQARADARSALKLSQSRDVNALAALTLAQAGDAAEAEKRASEIGRTFPLDTLAQRYWLPTIHAAIALESNDPSQALEFLKEMGPIELGLSSMAVNVFLCPVYLRGEAYLILHDGKAAAPEFQKFIDYYGVLGNFSWGALARLGVARAYALEAQTDPTYREKARTAYQNFLALWKDADPDIPIYRQAKAEYANLK